MSGRAGRHDAGRHGRFGGARGQGRGGGRGGGSRGGPRGGRVEGGQRGGRAEGGQRGGRAEGGQRGGRAEGGQRGGRAEGGQRGGRFGRTGRGGGQRGGRSVRPDLSNITSVLTNSFLANVMDHFSFYQYSINATDHEGKQIDSRGRRMDLFKQGVWESLLIDMPTKEKDDLKRVVFFAGSVCYSSRPIPGLEGPKLPIELAANKNSDGETMTVVGVTQFTVPKQLSMQGSIASGQGSELSFDLRCSNCVQAFRNRNSLLQHCRDSGHGPVYAIEVGGDPPKPAPVEVFVSYTNLALQRAMGERLVKWGRVYIDPNAPLPAVDARGNDMGVNIFEAYSCHFGVIQNSKKVGPARLALTCDLRAKVIRKISLLDVLYAKRNRDTPFSRPEQDRAKRDWIGEVVIYMNDRKCYTVTDLEFEHSPKSLPVPERGMSHAEYFQNVKKVNLKYPEARPMIAVLGRNKQTIYLPAELVTGNELDPRVREQLPKVASFRPERRTRAIEKIKAFLIPGAQRTRGAGGLLPAIGIILESDQLRAKAEVLPLPRMIAAGVEVPKAMAENWAPILSRANFDIDPKKVLTMNVVVFHHSKLRSGALRVYQQIRDRVNSFRSFYRFGEHPLAVEEVGDNGRHWGHVERYFSQKMPSNIFVLDFVKPPYGSLDLAYPVVKQMLTAKGYLSQFVNFNTYAHDNPKEVRRSQIILQGVARQILQKAGVRLWWVSIPKSLPLPAVFVGVDVFHTPMVYDPKSKQRGRKASCAAIIVEVIRKSTGDKSLVELYSETFTRSSGNEFELGDALQKTVSNALKTLEVNPLSAIVWRDGISDSAFDRAAQEEITGIRLGLSQGSSVVGDLQRGQPQPVQLAYIVCQKRIDTKFLTIDGKYGAPSGTLVKGIQGLQYETFYINGRAPPFSTPKPVRYIVVEKDRGLSDLALEELTWGQCHSYPNWTGPIKVPSTCQMAHKLAELAGSFADCGETISSASFKNKIHFL